MRSILRDRPILKDALLGACARNVSTIFGLLTVPLTLRTIR
jgi:hypothetical protein